MLKVISGCHWNPMLGEIIQWSVVMVNFGHFNILTLLMNSAITAGTKSLVGASHRPFSRP
jgi:hypothetical protein